MAIKSTTLAIPSRQRKALTGISREGEGLVGDGLGSVEVEMLTPATSKPFGE
jgi:hypothetical protein